MSQPQAATALGVDQTTISSDPQKSSEDEDNVLTQKPLRARWQLFAAGFAVGGMCFVVAVMLSRFLGYPSSGPIVFWLCLVPAATIILLRRFRFGDAQKNSVRLR